MGRPFLFAARRCALLPGRADPAEHLAERVGRDLEELRARVARALPRDPEMRLQREEPGPAARERVGEDLGDAAVPAGAPAAPAGGSAASGAARSLTWMYETRGASSLHASSASSPTPTKFSGSKQTPIPGTRSARRFMRAAVAPKSPRSFSLASGTPPPAAISAKRERRLATSSACASSRPAGT